LQFIGTSVFAQYVLSSERLNTWIQVNIGWGLAITFASIPVAKLSGAHLNPAISLMMWTFGDLSFIQFTLYSIIQTFGAFFGAATTYIVYYDAINEFDGGNRTALGLTGTANIFITFPATYLSVSGAYIDQLIGTGFFALSFAAITDKRSKIPVWVHPILFGLVYTLIGTSLGMNVGYPINPARDFGPRIFTLFIYGTEVFTYPYLSWFLIPIIAPLSGAILFGWSYYLFSGMHIPDDDVLFDDISYPRFHYTYATV
uniref:Aquaporin-like protein n=1 Tax=Thelazia callipaeda TaxID=103827 RepID=A0A158RC85_THECL